MSYDASVSRTPALSPAVDRRLAILLAVTVGLVVGNLYYAQPLLGVIADDLKLNEAQVGTAATLGLVGQAAAMLLVLPLGDVRDRRPLILLSVAASVVSLLAVSLVESLPWFALACLTLGLATTGTHMTISLAASLAKPEQRGRVVGTVVGGLLTGILLSRAASGTLAALVGWRAVYVAAAVPLVVLFIALWHWLPSTEPQVRVPYRRLLASLGSLLRDEPVLRESCLFGAATFGAFNAFWMTLAFHLESPTLGYGSRVAGLMALLAVVGALGAGGVGRLADRLGARHVTAAFLALSFASFALLWAAGGTLWGLGLGVVLMDLGVQGVHVCNQSRVYGLRPEASNRLGTIYIVTYFAGGAAGSALGVYGWTQLGWLGVCLTGGSLVAVALTTYVRPIAASRAVVPLASTWCADAPRQR